jgi:hypothetical protein
MGGSRPRSGRLSVAHEVHILGVHLAERMSLSLPELPDSARVSLGSDEPALPRPIEISLLVEPPQAMADRVQHEQTRASLREALGEYASIEGFPATVTTLRIGGAVKSREGWAVLSWVEQMLRLWSGGFVRRGAGATFNEDPQGQRTRYAIHRHHYYFGSPYPEAVCDPGATEALGTFLTQMATCSARMSRREIVIASRYLSKAYDNVLPEDRVLFLTIAMEAMLSPSDNNELKFRVGQRAARLLASDEITAQGVREACSAAYDVRSKVAHGDFAGWEGSRRGAKLDHTVLVPAIWAVVRRLIVTLAQIDVKREDLGKALDEPFFPNSQLRRLLDDVKVLPCDGIGIDAFVASPRK